jgi:hypothetical protein
MAVCFFKLPLALCLKEESALFVVMYAIRRLVVAVMTQIHFEAVLLADLAPCTAVYMMFLKPSG